MVKEPLGSASVALSRNFARNSCHGRVDVFDDRVVTKEESFNSHQCLPCRSPSTFFALKGWVELNNIIFLHEAIAKWIDGKWGPLTSIGKRRPLGDDRGANLLRIIQGACRGNIYLANFATTYFLVITHSKKLISTLRTVSAVNRGFTIEEHPLASGMLGVECSRILSSSRVGGMTIWTSGKAEWWAGDR